MYRPSVLVLTVWVKPVFWFLTVTVASAMEAPEASVVSPRTVPRSCAKAAELISKNIENLDQLGDDMASSYRDKSSVGEDSVFAAAPDDSAAEESRHPETETEDVL